MKVLATLVLSLPLVFAAQAPVFVPPGPGPTEQSDNYVGKSNGSLPVEFPVPGRVFNRFIQIWLENTNFAVANSSAVFQTLAQQGITMTNYFALTHPSEPNYVAAVGGDFFGMADDNLYMIPSNISTIVDLLEERRISWASYQESMPTDGFTGFSFASENYLNTSAAPLTLYWRKHNPLIIYNSVADIPSRAARHRNFNDFAVDINHHALPQWMFVTPNIENDAHDTNVDFAGQFLQYWLFPLLKDVRFNGPDTLILLTFDENGSSSINNNIFSLLLGNAVPKELRGTTDSTYFTHYSSLSTVQNNWGLGSLGRGDTNKTLANVFSMVAERTGYRNLKVVDIPLTNISGKTPGPLNSNISLQTPFPPPNIHAKGAGGGPVFVARNFNLSHFGLHH
ncbi:hypothetical protein M422DRAFT_49092 [Sphaerobolus stellatus SS14]|uniref:Acid phosphatase n=1 Tax=Sphaerobolus stellatus (strain SS14) TaxID=990650 RepID=A0A0C9VRE7_SPHS4|nr:hypothetical protein M422DRAFT_49092 [Sphaerobolus stellatus SS14]